MGLKRQRKLENADQASRESKKPCKGGVSQLVLAQNRGPLDEIRLKESVNWLGDVVDQRRIQWMTDHPRTPNFDGRCVVCFLQREIRAQDNWALLLSQDIAIRLHLPIYVVHIVVPRHTYQATPRHMSFHLGGLEELYTDLKVLNINFYCFAVSNSEDDGLNMINAVSAADQAVKSLKPSVVTTDFTPLRLPREFTRGLAKTCLEQGCPLLQVDARNIVPVWFASNKQEYAARTIRPKIMSRLSEFACDFAPLVPHPYTHTNGQSMIKPVKGTGVWETPARLRVYLNVDQDSELSREWTPGAEAGLAALSAFCCCQRLAQYAFRNNPLVVGQSDLSPWIHFGQLSAQRCVRELTAMGTISKIGAAAAAARDMFIEELVIRRELAENFTFYNPAYDSINGAMPWAQETLRIHAQDPRTYIYSEIQLENAQTHDELWNASQVQLRLEGKMHGFLRMYWAKKILEWTVSPEHALKCALHLNDKYSMDGTSPNGVVGCMWSIAGIHDQGWPERPIFGKIRYMNFAGCRRKFSVEAFVAKYKGALENSEEIIRFSEKRPTVPRQKPLS